MRLAMANSVTPPKLRKTRVELAIELEEAFAATHDQRFLDASKILMSERKCGPRPKPDTDALYRMARLIATNAVNSRWAAACRVAKEIGGHSQKSTAARLDRKYAEHGDYYRRTLDRLGSREAFAEWERQIEQAAARAAPAMARWEEVMRSAQEAFERTNSSDWKGALARIEGFYALQGPGLSPEELRKFQGLGVHVP